MGWDKAWRFRRALLRGQFIPAPIMHRPGLECSSENAAFAGQVHSPWALMEPQSSSRSSSCCYEYPSLGNHSCELRRNNSPQFCPLYRVVVPLCHLAAKALCGVMPLTCSDTPPPHGGCNLNSFCLPGEGAYIWVLILCRVLCSYSFDHGNKSVRCEYYPIL